jgi:hypothetical protein
MSKSKWWVGQRVHACGWGEGVVKKIVDGDIYPIKVSFGINRSEAFAEDGKWRFDIPYPVLFPIDTERPKATVKRRVEGWVVWYTFKSKPDMPYCVSYPSLDDANKSSVCNRPLYCNTDIIPLGPPEHIVKEWEE